MKQETVCLCLSSASYTPNPGNYMNASPKNPRRFINMSKQELWHRISTSLVSSLLLIPILHLGRITMGKRLVSLVSFPSRNVACALELHPQGRNWTKFSSHNFEITKVIDLRVKVPASCIQPQQPPHTFLGFYGFLPPNEPKIRFMNPAFPNFKKLFNRFADKLYIECLRAG